MKEMTEIGTIRHEGKSYSNLGSVISKDKNGKYVALMYAYPKENKIGTWNGKKKWDAKFGTSYKIPAFGGFSSERVPVQSVINGIPFSGTYYKSSGDIVRLKQVKIGSKRFKV